jgi:hypothetical protein
MDRAIVVSPETEGAGVETAAVVVGNIVVGIDRVGVTAGAGAGGGVAPDTVVRGIVGKEEAAGAAGADRSAMETSATEGTCGVLGVKTSGVICGMMARSSGRRPEVS